MKCPPFLYEEITGTLLKASVTSKPYEHKGQDFDFLDLFLNSVEVLSDLINPTELFPISRISS